MLIMLGNPLLQLYDNSPCHHSRETMSNSITHLIKPRLKDLGGFAVRRLLPAPAVRMIGPFIFFDHFGPATFPAGEGLDVRPHPHIGLATVTYLFEGVILHRDSLGTQQLIHPGDVNWMTAGRGIVHSERTPVELRPAGPPLHGLQTWVALPQAFEETTPAFFHHPAASLPTIEQPGVTMRVIAGHAFGQRSPVETFSDMLYVAVTMNAGSRFTLPAEHMERGIYLVEGDVAVDGEALAAQHLAALAEGMDMEVRARTGSRLVLLGGEKADGYRFAWWNFVSSSRARIEQAKIDWREQRMGKVPDDDELIPLPDA